VVVLEGSEQWCNQMVRSFVAIVPAGTSLLIPSNGRRIFASIFTTSIPAIQVWITEPDFSGGFSDNPAYFVGTIDSVQSLNLHSREFCDMVASDIWVNAGGVATIMVAEILNEWPAQCGGLEQCPLTTSRWVPVEIGALDTSKHFVFSQDIRRIAFSWSPFSTTFMRISNGPEPGLVGVWREANPIVFPPLLYIDYGPLLQSEIWVSRQTAATQGVFRESTIVG